MLERIKDIVPSHMRLVMRSTETNLIKEANMDLDIIKDDTDYDNGQVDKEDEDDYYQKSRQSSLLDGNL